MRAIQPVRAASRRVGDPPWLARFRASLAREDLSPATLRGCLYAVRHLLRWHCCLQETPFIPERLAEYDLIAYRQHMIAGGDPAATRSNGAAPPKRTPDPPTSGAAQWVGCCQKVAAAAGKLSPAVGDPDALSCSAVRFDRARQGFRAGRRRATWTIPRGSRCMPLRVVSLVSTLSPSDGEVQ